MINGDLRSKVDKLWENFWTGGITNPLTVIEQITFLMFIRLLDLREQRAERKASLTGKEFKGFFDGRKELRWSFLINLSADKMLIQVRDKVFPSLRDLVNGDSILGRFMQDAQLMIQKPSLLQSAVDTINKLPLEKDDTKGKGAEEERQRRKTEYNEAIENMKNTRTNTKYHKKMILYRFFLRGNKKS
jgi:type I restriction enzyme M protein